MAEAPGGWVFAADDAVAALRAGEVQLHRHDRRAGAGGIEQFQARRRQLLRVVFGDHAEPPGLQPYQRAQRVDAHRAHEGLQDLGIERSEEHTSELQSLMRISYAVFCLKKKITTTSTSY